MEKYSIKKNEWTFIRCRLNEGRYHASACLVGKWIYVFGGYRTKRLVGQYQVQIDRKNEEVVSVTSNRVERYDTSYVYGQSQASTGTHPHKPSSSETDNTEDEATSLATLDNIETWATFELLSVKRDYAINNLG